jgi:hypothetical protein
MADRPTTPAIPSRPFARLLEQVGGRLLGRRVYAITLLTLKAAFRYRLIQVLLLLLLVAVLGLPAIIKHDGSAQGFTQILLTYTLGSITVLLGFATLWLGCGTLSRDVEECQMQVVAVKPIARWQIWLGKWLGIMTLNAGLLALSGFAVYSLTQWRAAQLPPDTQAELHQNIMVARGSARPSVPWTEIQREADRQFQLRIQQENIAALDRNYVRTQIVERVKAQRQIVPPGTVRRWTIDLGLRANALRQETLAIRTRFYAADQSTTGTFGGWWEIGPPNGLRHRLQPMSLAPETFHEFTLPPGFLDNEGVLTIDFYNFNDLALLFPLQDGIEILYPEGSFALNFARALGIIFCWLGLLAAIGLAAGSFLSFPVAAFCTIGLLIVSSSTGTLRQVIEEGGVTRADPSTGKVETPALVDHLALPLANSLLWTINVVRDFSPVDSLSTGRSISWSQLGRAVAQIILLMGGLFAAAGIILFTRRELATAQGP